MGDNKRKLKSSLLTTFFKRVKPIEDSEDPSTRVAVEQQDASEVPSTSTATNIAANINDIGHYVDIKKDTLTEEQKFLLFQKVWNPDDLYKFPTSGKRNLKFQYFWLRRWTWLVYSAILDGAFCRYCVFFSSYYGGVGQQPLGKLVISPFSAWKDAVEMFNRHQNLEYHKFSVLRAESRLSVAEGKKESIEVMLNSSLKEQIKSNRERLFPIIETVIFCGRQGISLRGHRDSGQINFDEPEPVENEGNFRALLRLRVKSGDENLKNHLTLASKKANYISPRIQNELINSCNTIIVNKLVNKVNASKSFSVLADETADIAGIEQLSLCVRYVENETLSIREDFLQFVPVSDLTGKGLANAIMEALNRLAINLQYMVGQGYDGAAAMSGHLQGAQQHIREKCDLAIYMHCASHCLNLALSDACEISSIRNCFGSIASIYNFFNTPKRQAILEKAIDDLEPESSATRLKQLCPTRWIQRHESVLVFLELQHATIDALETISIWNDRSTSSMAVQLLAVIRSTDFQMSLHTIAKLFAVTLPLSRQLQTKNQDLSEALELAADVENIMIKMRNEAEQTFHQIFTDVVAICDKLEIEISIPRRVGRQTQRCNIKTENPEEYYRISIFIPFLENILTQIQERFLKHNEILSSFKCIFPVKGSQFENCHEKNARILLMKYQSIVNCGLEEGIGELKIWWYRFLTRVDETDYPKSAIGFLRQCNKDIFPTVHKLIKIFCTIPVTTATNERAFSTLRRLKTYLRNTIGEDRLNGLALLNIHRDIVVHPEEILNDFARHSRKMNIHL